MKILFCQLIFAQCLVALADTIINLRVRENLCHSLKDGDTLFMLPGL